MPTQHGPEHYPLHAHRASANQHVSDSTLPLSIQSTPTTAPTEQLLFYLPIGCGCTPICSLFGSTDAYNGGVCQCMLLQSIQFGTVLPYGSTVLLSTCMDTCFLSIQHTLEFTWYPILDSLIGALSCAPHNNFKYNPFIPQLHSCRSRRS